MQSLVITTSFGLASNAPDLNYSVKFLKVPCLTLQVDLTAYVEKHEFVFDAVLDQHVSNDEVFTKQCTID